ncbi:MAG: hypothetical protein QF570_04470 [Myxococcota bacterium]|jgi:hypothetical protein|nr:hypothetical protein [Myxococcota bacterium]
MTGTSHDRVAQRDRDRIAGLEARFVVASFLVVLVAWAAASFFHEPGPIAKSENRYRAALPVWGESQGTAEFIAKLGDHLADRVRFRDALISLHARVMVDFFGASPSEKLIVGRDGWFFFNDPVAVDQARGIARFDDAELLRWQRVLEGRRDWLAERGIPFVVVLVPNKHVVYAEFMPPRFGATVHDEQHKQLAHHLAEHSDLVVVDLLPPLLEAKQRQRVYHKTDTHWNDIGAYTGYREILAAVGDALPTWRDALEPVKVQARRFEDRGIGLTSMVGLSPYHREEILQLRKVQPRSEILMPRKDHYKRFEREQRPLAHGVQGARLPKAVVFRDSFFNALIPYFSENFRRVLYVWTRDVEPRFVEREQPDIVIQEIAGRLLDREPIGIEVLARRSSE